MRSGGERHGNGSRATTDSSPTTSRSEFLYNLSAEEELFLTRTSILDRICAPLCDAVSGTTDSAAVLESLEESNLLLVPLDRQRNWYRYHHLFRGDRSAELEPRDPDTVAQLHVRAAAWCEANSLPEMALEHAEAGGDHDRAIDLILDLAQPTWASGRVDTVLRWMDWIEQQGLTETYPGHGRRG